MQGNPMAFLVENGGGRAITHAGRVLDLQPSKIHERCPIFLGSKQDVDRIEQLHSNSG
jgi:fructose-1,6-bisphosphatase I